MFACEIIVFKIKYLRYFCVIFLKAITALLVQDIQSNTHAQLAPGRTWPICANRVIVMNVLKDGIVSKHRQRQVASVYLAITAHQVFFNWCYVSNLMPQIF